MNKLYFLIGLGIVFVVISVVLVKLLFRPLPPIRDPRVAATVTISPVNVTYAPTYTPTGFWYPTPQFFYPTTSVKNWKTYRDTANKFQLSYPADWSFDAGTQGSVFIDNEIVSWDLKAYSVNDFARGRAYIGTRQWPTVTACGTADDLCGMITEPQVYDLFGYPVRKHMEFVRRTNQVYMAEFLLNLSDTSKPGFGWVDPVPQEYPQLAGKVDKTKYYVLNYQLMPRYSSQKLSSVNDLKEGINPYMTTLDAITNSLKIIK